MVRTYFNNVLVWGRDLSQGLVYELLCVSKKSLRFEPTTYYVLLRNPPASRYLRPLGFTDGQDNYVWSRLFVSFRYIRNFGPFELRPRYTDARQFQVRTEQQSQFEPLVPSLEGWVWRTDKDCTTVVTLDKSKRWWYAYVVQD